MRHGLAYIYELPPPENRFDELVNQIQGDGMSLSYPPTGEVIQVLLEGKQRMTTVTQLREFIANHESTTFNFYLRDDTSTTCTFSQPKKGTWQETYTLDGKNASESLAVIESLTKVFVNRALKGTAFAFVVDEYAEIHRDFHWDDFIFGERPDSPEWPLRLGFSRQFLAAISVPFEKYKREDGENYVILRRLSA